MVKSRPPPKYHGTFGRDGRAAEGACLENMFGRKPNVGSNPTPSALSYRLACGKVFRLCRTCQHSNLKTFKLNPGRCQSGRMGPPAKRLLGRNPQSQVRILSSPPHKNTSKFAACFCFQSQALIERMIFESCRQVPATRRRVLSRARFCFQSHAPSRDDIRILSSPPHENTPEFEACFCFQSRASLRR